MPLVYRLPVLSERDKRAFLLGLWSPFIPDATWETHKKIAKGAANVYLDVSGSMNAEMPFIVALLNRLRSYIRMPFWAFSNVVAKAKIVKGALVTETTGGTSMNCVLEHIAKTKPQAAVVITDGYIEEVDKSLLKQISMVKLHVLISRDGSASEIHDAGIPYTQLERLPT
jgi:predicted metal-dependent peptidase